MACCFDYIKSFDSRTVSQFKYRPDNLRYSIVIDDEIRKILIVAQPVVEETKMWGEALCERALMLSCNLLFIVPGMVVIPDRVTILRWNDPGFRAILSKGKLLAGSFFA